VVANKRGASELIFKPETVKPQSSVTLKPVEIVSYLVLTDDPKAYRDYKMLQNHIL